jgi:hypothetical protein
MGMIVPMSPKMANDAGWRGHGAGRGGGDLRVGVWDVKS